MSRSKALLELVKAELQQRVETESATVLVSPASQSSVEIESRVKGPPGVKVKVYDADPRRALVKAMELYGEAVQAYAPKDGEASSG